MNTCLLDFSYSHIHEYKVDIFNLKIPKILFALTKRDYYTSINSDDTYHVDHLFYTNLLTSRELHCIHGLGYDLVSKYGYGGRGCGPDEQGI